MPVGILLSWSCSSAVLVEIRTQFQEDSTSLDYWLVDDVHIVAFAVILSAICRLGTAFDGGVCETKDTILDVGLARYHAIFVIAAHGTNISPTGGVVHLHPLPVSARAVVSFTRIRTIQRRGCGCSWLPQTRAEV